MIRRWSRRGTQDPSCRKNIGDHMFQNVNLRACLIVAFCCGTARAGGRATAHQRDPFRPSGSARAVRRLHVRAADQPRRRLHAALGVRGKPRLRGHVGSQVRDRPDGTIFATTFTGLRSAATAVARSRWRPPTLPPRARGTYRGQVDRRARSRADRRRVGRHRDQRSAERSLRLARRRHVVRAGRPRVAARSSGRACASRRATSRASTRPATRSRRGRPRTSRSPATAAAPGPRRRSQACRSAGRRSCWSPRSIRAHPTRSI